MRTFSPPAHRARRRAIAEQLAPAALRTRPYTHPLADEDGPLESIDEPALVGSAVTPRR